MISRMYEYMNAVYIHCKLQRQLLLPHIPYMYHLGRGPEHEYLDGRASERYSKALFLKKLLRYERRTKQG